MRLRFLIGAAALVFPGSLACSRPPLDGTVVAPPAVTPAAAAAAHAVRAGGIVTSADPAGRPRFIRAITRPSLSIAAASPETAAREHFARFASAYGIDGDAVAQVAPDGTGRTPRGDYLVRMRQQVGGIEVYRSDLKVVMRPDLSLVALSGTPSEITGVKADGSGFTLSPGQALQRALEHLYRTSVPEAAVAPARLAQEAGQPYVWLDLPRQSPVTLSEPARAKPIYYRSEPVDAADSATLVPAYFVEFFSSREPTATTSDAYRYLIAADDGRVLEQRNLTADIAFNYRVFADPSGDRRPLDGPVADYTPHPTGTPGGTDPAFVPATLVSMDTFKTRPPMRTDSWLATNAVQTLGNNVDAYADLFAPDGYSNGDLRATTTSQRTFDRSYDTSQDPGASTLQTMAATTNLFYTINWLHDYWYDSGFDEAAGNAQTSNFGRGGVQADALRAEAQDLGGLNNANMSIPADGFAPRMQMYLWSGPVRRALTIEPGSSDLVHGNAAFGPQVFDVSGEVILGVDGTTPTGDACEPLVDDVAGRIVLVDRGTCGFASKTQIAEAGGAIGVILANNVAGPPGGMPNPVPPITVGIPTLSVSLDDGNRIKAMLAQEGGVRARLFRDVGARRDGSIDNMIVAHEWGHYFHFRLSDCGTSQCGAMSEGWGDFLALHMALREGDNLDGTFGAGVYAPRVVGDSGYFGIRRFPYSVDFSKNGLTFKHIQNGVPLPPGPVNGGGPNSEVHNAGEVWCSMLLEAYVGLHKNPGQRSFDQVRRAFADYLVLGLQLAPPDATFTEVRDAILTAAAMSEASDVTLIAEAFARRGAGSCAVGAPRQSSVNLAPVTEAFAVQPAIAITGITVDDSVDRCDSDGVLDGGETGRVQVQVTNNGPIAMTDTQITLSTATAGVLFPDGPSTTMPSLAAFGTQTLSLVIALEATVTEMQVLDLTVTVASASACTTSVAQVHSPRIHADEKVASTATETVEASAPPWGHTGAGADNLWSRTEIGPGSHAFLGRNSGSISDTQLVSPPLQVSARGDFQIAFDHAFSFDASRAFFWDGGVIEITSDDGATWLDISTLADPGYNATFSDRYGNPLQGRAGYGSVNASYPNLDHVSLNLGAALAGQTVRIRFRIGTDSSASAPGWTIDNLAVQGIDNLPFTSVIPHTGNCQVPPVAQAGSDRTVRDGADVILDGTGSTDPNGDPIAFLWTQTDGPAVQIFNPTSAVAAFKAPSVSRNQTLTFQLAVSDPSSSSTDSVTIEVMPADPTEVPEEPNPIGTQVPDPGLGGE